MTGTALERETPWAFWSPTADALIERALTLAGVGRGCRVLDIGCGDGRVLLAAAKLGASVRGIELDAGLASLGRRRLAEAGFEVRVEEVDAFDADLEADIVFAYLTPAMLARLATRFAELPVGTRIVTPRYRVAGWSPARSERDVTVYQVPCEPAAPEWPLGWGSDRAVLVTVPAGQRMLLPLRFGATRGQLALDVDAQLSRAARFVVAFDAANERCDVPIDVIFGSHGAGSVIAGAIRLQGAELALAAVFSSGAPTKQTFAGDEGREFRRALDQAVAEVQPEHGTVRPC